MLMNASRGHFKIINMYLIIILNNYPYFVSLKNVVGHFSRIIFRVIFLTTFNYFDIKILLN